MDFNFKDFLNLLEVKEVLISNDEVEEFFEEICEILSEGTNVFEQMDESKVFERIAEILVFMSVPSKNEMSFGQGSQIIVFYFSTLHYVTSRLSLWQLNL